MIARPKNEVWAQLILSERDSVRIREFFINECEIKAHRVVSNFHMTIYYARRLMPAVVAKVEAAQVVLPATETRFMVMAPGGENPRPELVPSKCKVGIRVHKQSSAMPAILNYRQRLLRCETRAVLGSRRPSTIRTNAFGARHFQPHVALLKPGSGIDRDLTKLGSLFRERIGNLTFDKFEIEVVIRQEEGIV